MDKDYLIFSYLFVLAMTFVFEYFLLQRIKKKHHQVYISLCEQQVGNCDKLSRIKARKYFLSFNFIELKDFYVNSICAVAMLSNAFLIIVFIYLLMS
jgi:hypothetical protein